jgi:hypothetical protein
MGKGSGRCPSTVFTTVNGFPVPQEKVIHMNLNVGKEVAALQRLATYKSGFGAPNVA